MQEESDPNFQEVTNIELKLVAGSSIDEIQCIKSKVIGVSEIEISCLYLIKDANNVQTLREDKFSINSDKLILSQNSLKRIDYPIVDGYTAIKTTNGEGNYLMILAKGKTPKDENEDSRIFLYKRDIPAVYYSQGIDSLVESSNDLNQLFQFIENDGKKIVISQNTNKKFASIYEIGNFEISSKSIIDSETINENQSVVLQFKDKKGELNDFKLFDFFSFKYGKTIIQNNTNPVNQDTNNDIKSDDGVEKDISSLSIFNFFALGILLMLFFILLVCICICCIRRERLKQAYIE